MMVACVSLEPALNFVYLPVQYIQHKNTLQAACFAAITTSNLLPQSDLNVSISCCPVNCWVALANWYSPGFWSMYTSVSMSNCAKSTSKANTFAHTYDRSLLCQNKNVPQWAQITRCPHAEESYTCTLSCLLYTKLSATYSTDNDGPPLWRRHIWQWQACTCLSCTVNENATCPHKHCPCTWIPFSSLKIRSVFKIIMSTFNLYNTTTAYSKIQTNLYRQDNTNPCLSCWV